MASTSSQGPSPHPSTYDFDSGGDTDESWQYLDFDFSSSSSEPASVGFLPSPASGSLASFALVGHMTTSSQASSGSPLPTLGDVDHSGLFSPSDEMLPSSMQENTTGNFVPPTSVPSGWTENITFLTPQAFLFDGQSHLVLPQQDVPGMCVQELGSSQTLTCKEI
jgi:hypothetical protein